MSCTFLTRQTIGELCHVRSLVLTFVLALNPGCRNDGGASCEYPPFDFAQCFGDGILRGFPRARAAEGMLVIEGVMNQTKGHRTSIRT